MRIELRARHKDKGLHGHQHVDRQRLVAILMIGTGLARVMLWTTLLTLNLVGVAFVVALFGSVSFVSDLSVLALMLTDWGQVAASLAQLTAGDAHHDAEATRRDLAFDVHEIEGDLYRLAKLTPGPEADELAAEIRAQLAGTPA